MPARSREERAEGGAAPRARRRPRRDRGSTTHNASTRPRQAPARANGKVNDMADLNAIADQLSSLTVMEAADLAKLLEQKWGVSAAAPVAVAAGGAVAAEVAAKEEKTDFDVILLSAGDKKIQVIKEVRA